MPPSRRSGVIVPHAPVLTLDHAHHEALAGTRAALAAIPLEGVDVMVVVSPHAPTTSVYREVQGDLAPFGMRGAAVAGVPARRLGAEVAEAWGKPLVDGPVDHGIVTPLLLLAPAGVPVVAVGLREVDPADVTDAERAAQDGRDLGRALHDVVGDAVVLLVASLHGCAGLSPGAPLTEVPSAREVETALVDDLERGGGRAVEHAVHAARVARSCAPGPLAALAAFLPGASVRVLSHEWPFGVGYLVAQVAQPIEGADRAPGP